MLIERKRSISEQQQSFIDYLVKDNKNPTESARLAGYAHPKQSAYVLTRNPNISMLFGYQDKHSTRPIWRIWQ